MDTHTVEACFLAAADEGSELGQGPANGDSESDAHRGHLTSLLHLSTATIRSLLRIENYPGR